MKNYHRLFVAAPLPALLVTHLDSYIPSYEKPGVRIVPEENWHLTFYFIGNVAAVKLPEIKLALQTLTTDLETFTLKLLRVAPGPNAKNPRLVWAMFEANKTFEKVVRKITFALGGKIDNQHPIPHITIARLAKDLPKPLDLPVMPTQVNTSFLVSEMALWESDLGSPHPKYSVLETFTFGTGK